MTEEDTIRILSRPPFDEVRKDLGYVPMMRPKELNKWLQSRGWTPEEFTTYAQENIRRGNV